MADIPLIRVDGTVSGVGTVGVARYVTAGETLTYNDEEAANTGLTYSWTLIERPIGSSAVLTGASTATPQLIPDVSGTYWVEANVEGYRSNIEVAVVTENASLRKPAFNERLEWNEGGNDEGWKEAQALLYDTVDQNATAFQPSIAGQILGLTEEVSPDLSAVVMIEDPTAGNAKRRVTLANLTTGGGGGTLDASYDFGGAGAGRTITADSGAVEVDVNSLGATGTTEALLLANTTLATSSFQVQRSPILALSGQAWDSGESASDDVRFGMQVRPVAGSPSDGYMMVQSSIDGGSYVERLRVTTGQVVVPDGSTTEPGFSFLGQLGTGISRTAGAMRMSFGGSWNMELTSTGIHVYTLGSASLPSWRVADTNSGIYAPIAGQVAVSTNGSQAVRWSSTHQYSAGSLFLAEQAGAAPDSTGFGQVWARTDNTLWFTDELGTSYQIGGVGSGGSSLDSAYDFGGAGAGRTITADSGAVELLTTAVGTTQTANLHIHNSTAAALNAQQYSPVLLFEGQGWKTDATAASQETQMGIQLVPVQGSANPSAELRVLQGINGGALAEVAAFTSGGALRLPVGSAAAPSLHLSGDPDTGVFWVAADRLGFSAGGVQHLEVNTSGIQVDSPVAIAEDASAPSVSAGYGYVWVQNSSPNTLVFTDDAGTDWPIAGLGSETTLDEAYDGGGSGVGRAITVDSGAVELILSGGGETSDDALRLKNTTAASSGTQQFSPQMFFEGRGWDGSASQEVSFSLNMEPFAGSGSVPGGTFKLKNSVNSFSEQWFLDNGGALLVQSAQVGDHGSGYTGILNLFPGGATGLTAAEVPLFNLQFSGVTYEFDSTGTPTIARQRTSIFEAPSYAGSSGDSVTITDAANVYVAGAPSAGANMSITNAWSLWIDSGAARFDGSLFLNEKASADTSKAGYGQLWVRDDTPNVIVFTDDAGTDFVLGSGGGGTLDASYDFGGAGAGRTITADSGAVVLLTDSVAQAQTASLEIQNTTAAVADVSPPDGQQWSPMLQFEGQGWKTDATAASQQVLFSAQLETYEGAANPTGELVFKHNINSAGWSDALRVTSGGQVVNQVGSAAAPSIAFDGFETSGFYGASGVPSVAHSGAQVAEFQISSGVGHVQLVGTGSATNLQLRSTSDGNTGIWWDGTDALGVATGGVESVRWNASQQTVLPVGSASSPSLVFSANLNSGFYGDSSTLRWSVGSVQQMVLTTTYLQLENTLRMQEFSAPATTSAGYGQIWVKNDTPNTLWFTDDTGADFQLGAGGGSLDSAYDSGGAGAGRAVTTDSGAVTLTTDSVNQAQTAALELINSTAAVADSTPPDGQQWSPTLQFEGQGWKTNATAASQQVLSLLQLETYEGAANPTGELVFSFDINGAGASSVARFTSDGQILSSSGSVSAPSLAFASDLDTGVFLSTSNTLNIATAGVERVEIDSTSIDIANTRGLYITGSGASGTESPEVFIATAGASSSLNNSEEPLTVFDLSADMQFDGVGDTNAITFSALRIFQILAPNLTSQAISSDSETFPNTLHLEQAATLYIDGSPSDGTRVDTSENIGVWVGPATVGYLFENTSFSSTMTNGMMLRNTSAATSSVSKRAPWLTWQSQGWDNTEAASNWMIGSAGFLAVEEASGDPSAQFEWLIDVGTTATPFGSSAAGGTLLMTLHSADGLVINADVDADGGFRRQFTRWMNSPSTSTTYYPTIDGTLSTSGNSSRSIHTPARAGSVVEMSAWTSGDVSAGQMDLWVQISTDGGDNWSDLWGSSGSPVLTLDSVTNTERDFSTVAKDTNTFAAGDMLRIVAVTDASFASGITMVSLVFEC